MTWRWSPIGGGGAKIGPVHLAAARRSGMFDLVAAAPSSRAQVAATTDWGCPATADWRTLLDADGARGSLWVSQHLPGGGEAMLAPPYADGVRGMRFIAATLESRGAWVRL
jgi:hypothetical protein